MHGNEAVGLQIVTCMAQYLLENYGVDDRVTKLVNTTDLWLMPSLNPDGFAAGKEGDCGGMSSGGVGRENANRQGYSSLDCLQIQTIILKALKGPKCS